MLAAANPRKPKLTPGWIRFGGADQAWLYREAYLPAWQAYDGALDWLRSSLRAFKRKQADGNRGRTVEPRTSRRSR